MQAECWLISLQRAECELAVPPPARGGQGQEEFTSIG